MPQRERDGITNQLTQLPKHWSLSLTAECRQSVQQSQHMSIQMLPARSSNCSRLLQNSHHKQNWCINSIYNRQWHNIIQSNVTRSSATTEIARIIPYTIYNQKLDFLGYTFITNSIGLASENLTQLAPKAVILCEIARNNGHWAVQGHSRSPILVLIERPYVTSY